MYQNIFNSLGLLLEKRSRKYYFCFDLAQGFHQEKYDEKSKPFTAAHKYMPKWYRPVKVVKVVSNRIHVVHVSEDRQKVVNISKMKICDMKNKFEG